MLVYMKAALLQNIPAKKSNRTAFAFVLVTSLFFFRGVLQ